MNRKNFSKPDSSNTMSKMVVDSLAVPSGTYLRISYEPGWKWSVDMAPVVGTNICQEHHVLFVVSGSMVVSSDGQEVTLEPGDVADIEPGHDAWVVGDEPLVALSLLPMD